MSSYLEIANKALLKQGGRKSIFINQMIEREGVRIVQVGDLSIIDVSQAKKKFTYTDIEHAIKFGFSVKIWSERLNAVIYMVEDLTLKNRLHPLVDEVAVFTLNETKLIFEAKLQKTGLHAIHSLNALLGATVTELHVDTKFNETK